ncbi:DUF3606 domain-containing protein [Pedobacter sp. JCM 36344]|uniref:DUF3606 domain-containing protein n=1 Tax=Pedobacter sp. JCM 36344 TaxID=3374280 RepID=UPI00397C6256
MQNKQDVHWIDSENINMEEYYIVEYWANKFDVKPEVLKQAVKAIGSKVDGVRKYLKK